MKEIKELKLIFISLNAFIGEINNVEIQLIYNQETIKKQLKNN